MLYAGDIAHHWGVEDTEGTPWNVDLLRLVVQYYGNVEPIFEEDEPYRVIPVTELTHTRFERFLKVERHPDRSGLDQDINPYVGDVYVDLPLDVDDDYDRPSDVTAIFFLRRIGAEKLALELYDVHVL